MSARISRGFRAAAKAADISPAWRWKVGAAIFDGPRLISVGWNNTRKSHPASTTRYGCQHAEFKALLGTDRARLVGSSIYIVRKMRRGGQGLAKPCAECARLIRAAGISRVYFTTLDGWGSYTNG